MKLNDSQVGKVYENATKQLKQEYDSLEDIPAYEEAVDNYVDAVKGGTQGDIDTETIQYIKAREFAHGYLQTTHEVRTNFDLGRDYEDLSNNEQKNLDQLGEQLKTFDEAICSILEGNSPLNKKLS